MACPVVDTARKPRHGPRGLMAAPRRRASYKVWHPAYPRAGDDSGLKFLWIGVEFFVAVFTSGVDHMLVPVLVVFVMVVTDDGGGWGD